MYMILFSWFDTLKNSFRKFTLGRYDNYYIMHIYHG